MELKEKLKMVDKLRKTMSIVNACKKAGISLSTYSYHKYKPGKAKPKLVKLTETKPARGERLMVFVGSPAEVMEAVRSLS